ncbi:response regulator transcription factor [Victivallis sp. Marseille-Q1083]|uniref:response regulator n=1 Tax=Victivallis sp. Marseille-Q1083 TaxID=2717288 RepID=UPI00158AA288|nr:response regulator transcription factor [Victivallis sp. Marseille-Q1083]
MRILLVEDDARTADFILKGLQQSGYNTIHAADGTDGLFKARTESYDLAIIDVMLPGLDGFTLVEKLRAGGNSRPIIILSAKNSVKDKIKGLENGSDDYLVKPFSFSELLARLQALLRRANTNLEPTTLRVGDLSVDLLSHKVYRGDVRIDIQPLEFSLLEYLARNAGRVVSKTMIMDHVWEYNFDPQTNIVETRMCRLREKIDKPFDSKLIHTIRGFGYVLEPQADFENR